MDCAAEIVSTLQLKPLCVSNVQETRICAEVVMKDGSILDDWFSMASATLNGLNSESGNALYVPSSIEVLFSLFLQLSRCVACERNGVHYEVFSFESVKSQIAKRFAVLYSGTVFRNETGGSTACFFARVPDKDWPTIDFLAAQEWSALLKRFQHYGLDNASEVVEVRVYGWTYRSEFPFFGNSFVDQTIEAAERSRLEKKKRKAGLMFEAFRASANRCVQKRIGETSQPQIDMK